MRWFAHSLPDDADRERWEPLRDHLEAVARSAEGFAAAFGAGALGHLAGLLHDLGKYDSRFQRRLAGEGVRHDHSTAGAQAAAARYGGLGKLLAFAIAGHHAGLADGARTGDARRTALKDRLAKDVGGERSLLAAQEDGLVLPGSPPTPQLLARAGLGGFQRAFLCRMLFSCLVDADFLETERFYVQAGALKPERPTFPAVPELRASLDAYLAREIVPNARPSEVNRLRGEVLAHVRAQSAHPPGVFTLTVPTGGGKTLASLAFALDHAERHGLDRLVYVIPFTSIVEQTADVFRKALGEAAVLEHHSAFDETKPGAREGWEKLVLAMENWDASVVVTTAVQFFESLFADRPSRCRKLHNLARSVIVLDEAQTLPQPLLRPCVAALDELARNYGASVVLCTATQPALKETDEAGRSFKGGFRCPHELAPDVPRLFAALKRVTVRHGGKLSDETLAERLAAADQALCIVNTRAHARALYERIAGAPGARHLSTLMCAAHRRDVLGGIRADLKAGRPCRVISTSLIEAGVDVDFPLVYRAEAGLDSIAQAAGRCNREGRNDPASSHTIVFEAEDEARGLKSLRIYADAARGRLRDARDPLAPETIEAYFREVYWLAGEATLDKPGILGLCEAHGGSLDFPFETVARNFRMIDDLYVPVIAPYGEADNLVRRLNGPERVGEIARKLQAYVVGVPERARRRLIACGAAEAVAPERFEEQFVRLSNRALYRASTGLDWSDPTFWDAASLIG